MGQEDIRMLRSILKMILILMFMGYAFLWIMMPTNTYKLKWQPQIRAKVGVSKSFGSQGYSLLVFTSPVILFASLCCVYVHLGIKLDGYHHKTQSEKKTSNPLSIWKQPVIVKGPLGIVSSIELAFFVMFIALLVWSFSTYLHNSFVKITVKTAAKNGEQV